MLFRIKHLLPIFIIAAICIIALSCEKEQPDCTGNCVSIRISGRVYDKTSGAGFKDVPVKVKWVESRYCIGCTSYKVAEGNTKNDGRFDFSNTIDSTFFNKYHLLITIPADTNYLVVYDSLTNLFSERSFYTLDVNALQQIKFEYYPKTFLKVKLHRVQTDAFSYFILSTNFAGRFDYGSYSIAGQQNARDTTLLFSTSADIYTRIKSEKKLNYLVTGARTDSIICTQNGANTIDINY